MSFDEQPIDEHGECREEIHRLAKALGESVKLQSHYAKLLNMWDGGKRMTFDGADAWMARLQELVDK